MSVDDRHINAPESAQTMIVDDLHLSAPWGSTTMEIVLGRNSPRNGSESTKTTSVDNQPVSAPKGSLIVDYFSLFWGLGVISTIDYYPRYAYVLVINTHSFGRFYPVLCTITHCFGAPE